MAVIINFPRKRKISIFRDSINFRAVNVAPIEEVNAFYSICIGVESVEANKNA